MPDNRDEELWNFFQSGSNESSEEFEFFPLAEPIEGGEMPFALMANETTQILKTPFGVFKISIVAGGPIAELGSVIQSIFKEGMTLVLLERLTRLIAELPQVREKLQQAPQLLELLESAKLVIAAQAVLGGSKAGISVKTRRSGMTFARARDAVHLN
jgi:hypothetical protein